MPEASTGYKVTRVELLQWQSEGAIGVMCGSNQEGRFEIAALSDVTF